MRCFTRLAPPTMEFLRARRWPGSPALDTRIFALNLSSRMHLAWHSHSHPEHLSRIIYPGAPAAVPLATRAGRIGRARITRPEQARPGSRAAAPSPAAPVARIVTLHALSTFISEFQRRLAAGPSFPGNPAQSSALFQAAAIEKISRSVMLRTRRVEDPAVRRLPEVARTPAATRTPAVQPVSAAIQSQPPQRRQDEAVETVHVAPWLKAASSKVNIEQIAEQVIRQIDSRVVAWRERMGRI